MIVFDEAFSGWEDVFFTRLKMLKRQLQVPPGTVPSILPLPQDCLRQQLNIHTQNWIIKGNDKCVHGKVTVHADSEFWSRENKENDVTVYNTKLSLVSKKGYIGLLLTLCLVYHIHGWIHPYNFRFDVPPSLFLRLTGKQLAKINNQFFSLSRPSSSP